MNIEEANDNLIMLKYFLQEEGDENWEKYCEAIETLLTAYEKEKGENVKLRLQDIPLIEGELQAYKDRVNELKQELEKEKEKNKITKQMNENLIEALKESISKDKIKAKIEPVLKQLERKMQEEYNKYGNSREYQDIVDAYNFLQSLLEKE